MASKTKDSQSPGSENQQPRTYDVTLAWPAGNITALVRGMVPASSKKPINDRILGMFPNVEQVGFYSEERNRPALEMAGGEFCGNALRSVAYLILEGKPGEALFSVFGVEQKLVAGVREEGSAFAQIPLSREFDTIRKLNGGMWQVDLDGISHIVVKVTKALGEEQAKLVAKELLTKTNLLEDKPASGVMFIRETDLEGVLEMEPVVFVRGIQTFFYETACASGTSAVGIWYNQESGAEDTLLKVRQPSREVLDVRVRKNNGQLEDVFIEGPMKILQRTEVSI